MRKSKTLAQIRNNQTVRMCCLGHYMPFFVKQAAHFGFDCIWLDLEHRNFSDRDVQALLAFAHLHDIDIMVRPATLEKTRLYRYLEDGAAGLMIPHVNTAEKARMLAESEGSRALIEAENALSTPVLHMKLEQYRLDRLPEIMSHMMKPIEKIDSIRINHVSGFGATNGAGGPGLSGEQRV